VIDDIQAGPLRNLGDGLMLRSAPHGDGDGIVAPAAISRAGFWVYRCDSHRGRHGLHATGVWRKLAVSDGWRWRMWRGGVVVGVSHGLNASMAGAFALDLAERVFTTNRRRRRGSELRCQRRWSARCRSRRRFGHHRPVAPPAGQPSSANHTRCVGAADVRAESRPRGNERKSGSA